METGLFTALKYHMLEYIGRVSYKNHFNDSYADLIRPQLMRGVALEELNMGNRPDAIINVLYRDVIPWGYEIDYLVDQNAFLRY